MQWHADLGILKNNQLLDAQLLDAQIPRTRSDAVVGANHADVLRMTSSNAPPFRRRTKSGDSITTAKHHSTRIDSEEEGNVGVAGRRGNIAAGGGMEGDGDLFEGGVAGEEVGDDRTMDIKGSEKFVVGSPLRKSSDTGNQNRLRVRDSSLRRSRSSEELSTIAPLVNGTSNHSTHLTKKASENVTTRDDADFCVLTYAEPDDINTGGEYTFILDDDCEDDYISDDDFDQSMEIKELIPLDSPQMSSGVREGTWTKSTPISPPRASATLISAFQMRLEYIMINLVDYPPGLFFVT